MRKQTLRPIDPYLHHNTVALKRQPILLFILAAGIALRVWQYLGDASMWLDEIALARGILERPVRELLTDPLPYNQVAPKGFLLVEKLMASVFGHTEYALRLFPLACSITALIVFSLIAVRVLTGAGPAIALLLFALAPPLITFGALVKQYSTDVCVALTLQWIAMEYESRDHWPRRAAWIALGGVLVWFSQPAVIVAAGLGMALVVLAVYRPEGFSRRFRELAPLLLVWSASSMTVTVVALASVTTETRAFLNDYWAQGFPPASLKDAIQTTWPRWQIRALFGVGGQASLGYMFPELYALLALVGGAAVWRSNWKHALLLMTPLGAVVMAAVARQYPFSDRLLIGFVPVFLLGLAASMEWIASRVRLRSGLAANVVLSMFVAAAVLAVVRVPPVYRAEDIKPVLSFVQKQRQSGDGVYVFYGAGPAVGYYASKFGLSRDDYASGGCHRRDVRQYLRELDAFRSHSRVWILITHPLRRERDDVLRYLDTIGSRREFMVAESRAVGRHPWNAEAHLYDLSDVKRLNTATAESFVVTPFTATDYGCELFDRFAEVAAPAP